MNRIYGLIGFPLSHSFSREYFNNKFRQEGINDAEYSNFELKGIEDLKSLIESNSGILGLNVTIPYKEKVFRYMDELDADAKRVGAVNVIKILAGKKLKGYNSDYFGFRTSLEKWMGKRLADAKAIVLGTGGAAKAVFTVLEDCNIETLKVSRSVKNNAVTYHDLRSRPSLLKEYNLIINTTPLGMFPKINEMPNLPYEFLNRNYYLYDLIYNPEKTLFLQKGEHMGCKIQNGKEMLVLQAERSWQIWNKND